MKYIDRVGLKFNNLTITRRLSNSDAGKVRYLCKCDCGNSTIVQAGNLTSGTVKSCGCLKIVKTIEKQRKHGLSDTLEYSSWNAMRRRCLDKKYDRYNDYGGRGISICNEWINSFEQFYADMGARPSPDHSIDRINVNGPYSKENCKWSTRSEQQRNKRKNVNNKEKFK